MNCKKGDLARFVGMAPSSRNYGRVVCCVEWLGRLESIGSDGYIDDSPKWRVEPKLLAHDGTITDICPDAWLRPIRPTDASDETLAWAGKPEVVSA